MSAKPAKPISIPSRRKTWKLKEAGISEEFEQKVTMKCQTILAGVENSWKSIKNRLLEAADEIYGWTQSGCQWHKETWLRNETVLMQSEMEDLKIVEKWRISGRISESQKNC